MTRNSRFAEVAGRLDRFIADLKTRQYEATGAGPRPAPVRPKSDGHPDLEWSRNYAARTIRPQSRGESASPDHAVPKMSEGLPETPSKKPSRSAPASGHIGAALGKPVRKRGVLARLFRGADR